MNKKEKIIKYAKENKVIDIDYLISITKASRQYVIEILRENGFKERRCKTEDEWNRIIQEYIDGKSLKELSKKFNITRQGIVYQLKKRGILQRAYKPHRKDNTLNEDYFGVLDTPEKMYLVGFLMADGCILSTNKYRKKPNRLYINISATDRELLVFIQKQLSTSQKIVDYIPKGTYSTNPMCSLSINSQKICSDLLRCGVTPNKTGKECICDEILNSDLLPHFIRGFFDGDGSVFNTKRAKWSHFSFCSNQNMLKQLVSIFKNKYDFTSKLSVLKDKRHDNIYNINITSKHDVLLFYKLIYSNLNSFCLNRKLNKIILPT